MKLTVSLGKADPAVITATWRGDFTEFCAKVLRGVKETEDKAALGWICGAEFTHKRRHGENFVARHLLSLDYDHLKSEDVGRILDLCRGVAFLAYTTWSSLPDRPRLRVWVPLSRPVDSTEFQAISRAFAARADIELAARESHTTAQFMYRPASKAGVPFEHWQDAEAPYLDVDKVLGEYSDYKDRSSWPHRKENDSCHEPTPGESPLEKPGLVGEFCRTWRVSAAIERFQLPYKAGSSEGRWTFTAGSRADGAVAYDDDTKLHSYHDTDPARGQHNAYDLVRLHLFGAYDQWDGADVPIADRESTRLMEGYAQGLPEIADARFEDIGFKPLDDGSAEELGSGTALVGVGQCEQAVCPSLPARIPDASGECTDLENARRIQARYGRNLLAIGQVFYLWSGAHWIKKDTAAVNLISNLSQMVRIEAEQAAAAGRDQLAEKLWKWSIKSAATGTMAAAEKLLRKHLDFDAENLNGDRGLLTCRTGTIDLRTGIQRAHQQADFITACAPTDYVPNAVAPRFQRFLREIFRGNEEVVSFVQRWFGYCITGEIREHALVFHIGEGGNGKGKLMEVLQYVLGNGYYAAGPRGLMSAKGSGATPEVAGLLGQRMVTLSETNPDEEFDPGLLKQLTGGDLLTARNLFEGYFSFKPTHKLQVFTNHEPRITGQDRGMWRRLFLLRYDVKYGRQSEVDAGEVHQLQDNHLDAKLAAEAAGILAWLVEGAREFYKQGLNPPPVVMKATEDFKAAQDHTGQFLIERTVKDPLGSVPLSGGSESLYVAYKGWMSEMGYRWLGRNKFNDALRRFPHIAYDTRSRALRGIRLATEQLT